MNLFVPFSLVLLASIPSLHSWVDVQLFDSDAHGNRTNSLARLDLKLEMRTKNLLISFYGKYPRMLAEILEKLSSIIFNLIPFPKGNKGMNNFCLEAYAVAVGAGQKGLHNTASVLTWNGHKTIPKFNNDLNLVHDVGISDIKRFNK